VPTARREALEVLWRLDASFAQFLSSSTQPITAQLKLTWWREALIALDKAPDAPEPLLEKVRSCLLAGGVSGAELAELVDGWEQLLANEALSDANLLAYGSIRGGALFHFSTRLLGCEPIVGLEEAGVGWALVDLARHSSHRHEAEHALRLAAAHLTSAPRRWPKRLRPIGMLAILARRDAISRRLGTAGSPVRILRMLAHRLSGR
jgi:15-cis-phytoene synthase